MNNLVNDQAQTTSLSLEITTSFEGASTVGGMSTGSDSGAFPDVVLGSYNYVSNRTAQVLMKNLNPSLHYNLILGCSRNLTGSRITVYSVGSVDKELECNLNTANTVQFNALVPDSSGNITLNVSRKDAAATTAYLNAMVIEELASSAPVNHAPTIAPLNPVTLMEGNSLTVTFTASDADGDALTFTTVSQPGFSAVSGTTANTISYLLSPTSSTVNQDTDFEIQVQVSDGMESSTQTLVIHLLNLGYQAMKVSFTTLSGPDGDSTWNNWGVNSVWTVNTSFASIKDQSGTVTPYGLLLSRAFTGSRGNGGPTDGGQVTGNNSGVVPDNVSQGVWYVTTGQTGGIKLTGLSSSKRYTLVIFASRAGTGTKATMFASQGQSVTIEASANTTLTATLSNLTPSATGEIEFTVAGVAGSPSGYLNAVTVTETSAP